LGALKLMVRGISSTRTATISLAVSLRSFLTRMLKHELMTLLRNVQDYY
jgi:hypothetical protein